MRDQYYRVIVVVVVVVVVAFVRQRAQQLQRFVHTTPLDFVVFKQGWSEGVGLIDRRSTLVGIVHFGLEFVVGSPLFPIQQGLDGLLGEWMQGFGIQVVWIRNGFLSKPPGTIGALQRPTTKPILVEGFDETHFDPDFE